MSRCPMRTFRSPGRVAGMVTLPKWRLPERKLERSSVEFYLGALIGIAIAVAPMNWWLMASLLLLGSCFVVDLCLRSPWLVAMPAPAKLVLVACALALIGGWGQGRVRELYAEAHIPPQLNDDLVVSFRFPDSAQLGTDNIDVDYIISNRGAKQPWMERIGIIEASSDTISAGDNLCGSSEIRDAINFSGFGNMRLGNHQITIPTQKIINGHEVAYIFMAPYSVQVNSLGPSPRLNPYRIDSGETVTVRASYRALPADPRIREYVLSICPVINVSDHTGREVTAVCHGKTLVGAGFGLRALTQDYPEARILPSKDTDSLCPLIGVPTSPPAALPPSRGQ